MPLMKLLSRLIPARGTVSRPRRHQLFAEFLESRDLLATLFVAPDGNDGSGGTAGSPFRTVQQAVNAALPGDTIRLAGGNYTYDPSVDQLGGGLGTRQVVTIQDKQLAIYGGYSRADGFQTSNPQANPTVIDGQDTYRGILVISTGNAAASIDLQGVTVRNGLATPIPARGDLDSTYAFGGGILIDMSALQNNSSRFLFRNVTFENNRAVGGNGIASNPNLNFGGAGAGGAMALRFANNTRLENVIFRSNQAIGGNGNERGGVALGGAIHVDQSNVSGDNVSFLNNSARSGSGSAGDGRDSRFGEKADATGGAVAVQVNASASFSNVTATGNVAVGGNHATGDAGSSYGAAFFAELGDILIRNAVVTGNRTIGGNGVNGGLVAGGAIYSVNGNTTIDRAKIAGNTATSGSSTSGGAAGAAGGGGVYLVRLGNNPNVAGTVQISNSVIAGNSVVVGNGRTLGGGGGGAWFQGVTATMSHVTVADNSIDPRLTFGEGIILINNSAPTPTILNLNYSIIAGHGGAAITNGPPVTNTAGNNRINFTRNLFFGNETNIDGGGTSTGGNSNFSGDPRFADPGAPFFNYSILSGSAAIDQATGSTFATDIGAQNRIGTPDVGAYELGTSGSFPTGSTAVGANTTQGPNGIALNGGPGNPRLVGYNQYAAGADAGGGPTVTLFNPDGTPRMTINAFDPSFTGGVRVAAADFTGDNIADIVVGTGPGVPTLVRVLDGVTGAELFSIVPFEPSFIGGVFVSAGDLNGDGIAELAISPDEGGGPRVRLFDGRTFNQIADFFGIDDPNFRGGARTAIADVNGDGKADLIVAAGFGGGPRVAIFDGASLASGTPVKLVNDFFAFEDSLRNGVFVAGGDVNGDGRADVILGGGPGGGPRVRIADGLSLLNGVPFGPNSTDGELANFFGGDVESRGGIRVAIKNLDGDAQADVVVGAGAGAGSRVTAYLGSQIGFGITPPDVTRFDAFPGFTGGVFVG